MVDYAALDNDGQNACWKALIAEAADPQSELALMRSMGVVGPTKWKWRDMWRDLAAIAARVGHVDAVEYIYEERGYYSEMLERHVPGTGVEGSYFVAQAVIASGNPAMIARAKILFPDSYDLLNR